MRTTPLPVAFPSPQEVPPGGGGKERHGAMTSTTRLHIAFPQGASWRRGVAKRRGARSVMAPSRQSMDLVNQEGARERHGVMVLVTPLVTRYSPPERLIASPASCPSAARAGHSGSCFGDMSGGVEAPATARLGEVDGGVGIPPSPPGTDFIRNRKEELLHA